MLPDKLNSCIAGRALMLQRTCPIEERLRVQASRCYHKTMRAGVGRKKKEKILSGFSTVQVYEEDVVQPLEIEEQLSLALMEVEKSRYMYSVSIDVML